MVGVGVPVHNGERYLAGALDALLDQTFEDFDIVISDNASTDATEEICHTYVGKDPRIRYFRQSNNLGAAPNFNFAFHETDTPYFRWAAHDDLIDPTYLERCVAVLDSEPSCVVAFPRSVVIDESGSVVEAPLLDPGLTSVQPHERVRATITADRIDEPIFGLMRSDALRRTRLHGSYTGSDRTLLMEMAVQGSLREVPDRLFRVRDHGERSTRAYTELPGHPRETWFDSSRTGKIVFPNWRRAEQYFTAIGRSSLPAADKVRCYRVIGGWLANRNWKRLVRDVLVAAPEAAERVRGGSHRSVRSS